jgi:competence protein ComEA
MWLWEEYRLQIIAGSLGLGLMGLGWWQMRAQSSTQEVVIIEAAAPTMATLVVDVAGAVESPGVYAIEEGSRIAEVLSLAGGVIAEADAEWLAKELNQAQVVTDGMKLYIPFKGELGAVAVAGTLKGTVAGAASGLIRVNSASRTELEELWGIGEKRAEAIIDNRPYSDLSEIVSKAKIPQSVLDKNEGKIGL